MQNTSETYRSFWGDPWTDVEVKCEIAGETYGHDRIFSINTRSTMFSNDIPTVGGAINRQLDLMLYAPGTIPKAAEIKLYIRLVNRGNSSEWIQKGVFFISSRDYDKENDTLTIEALDAIAKMDTPYTRSGEQGKWPQKDIDIVNEICERVSVTLDARTRAILTRGYLVQYPGIVLEDGTPQYDVEGAYSMREVLGYIGSMYVGNWIMSDTGELRLVVLGDIPTETHYLVEEHGDAITLGGVRILV